MEIACTYSNTSDNTDNASISTNDTVARSKSVPVVGSAEHWRLYAAMLTVHHQSFR
jgi:hypothetical protein